MDRLQAMQTFVRVVESGSFTAVAHEQKTTQSTISKQVASLERTLGAKLLSRTTRSLALTETGERYFQEARRLVAEIEEAESSLRQGEQQLRGWLHVAASVGYGRRVLMPMVQKFLVMYPSIKIDLKLNDGFIDLIEQGIDVAVRIGDLSDSGLIARRISTTNRALLASCSYLDSLAGGLKIPLHPGDLTAHNCIVYTELSTNNEWSFTAGGEAGIQAGTAHSVRVNGNLQTNSSEVIRAAVLGGIGISYSPTWLFTDEINSGEVKLLLPTWQTQPLPVHLVSPSQRYRAIKVRLFGEFVAKELLAHKA